MPKTDIAFSPHKKLIKGLIKKPESIAVYKQQSPRISIEEEIARKKQIENEGLRQDIHLKKMTLILLFIFLGVETVAIFSFAFLQAIKNPWNFHLEEWSFKLLIAATISQITLMLQIAVKHLFPKKDKE